MFRSAQHDSASFRRRLLKRLESAFPKKDTLTSILSLRERQTTKSPGEGNSNAFRLGRDLSLERQARELLRELGAGKLAREVRVEWNPRMKSAAGRADFREKLISLNPLLHDHGQGRAENQFVAGKLDCLKQSSLTSAVHVVSQQTEQHAVVHDEIDRTLRHELAHLLAQFRVGRRRIAPHGPEWRIACRDLGILMRWVVTICRSQRKLIQRVLFIAVRIAGRNFRASAGSAGPWPVSLVVAGTTEENSTVAFDCG
jgi:predicted SprT family Zn-dependent metalloprotease